MSRLTVFAVWSAICLLISTVLVFASIRVIVDTPLILAGTTPPDDAFEARYVSHPVLAYLHIVPGLVFLVGAPFQLSRRFRARHRALHRRLGRVLVMAGVASGIFALAFGLRFPAGGPWEAAATAVFGSYFLVCLMAAYQAIRSGAVDAHRRWMIRAFAIGLASGTVRIWGGILFGFGDVDVFAVFAPSFWLGFTMHAVAAELWLAWRPSARGRSAACLVSDARPGSPTA